MKAGAKLTAYDDGCLVSQCFGLRRNEMITVWHKNVSDETVNLLDRRTDLLLLFPRNEICLTANIKIKYMKVEFNMEQWNHFAKRIIVI